jgi:DNA (cytosine-5)-methyltransferase 1
VPFYRDLIESGHEIFLSGYAKPITDGNPLSDGGVAVCDAGPVAGWWVAGFDGGERHVIGVTTEMAHYYLTEPSELYSQFMTEIDTKTFIAKCVIEHLMTTKNSEEEVDYEDVLTVLESRATPPGIEKINEDAVVKYADFLVSQVCSYEEAADDDEELYMMDTPAVKNLMALAGINRVKKKPSSRVKAPRSANAAMKKAVFTKACTTELVGSVMEVYFSRQMANNPDGGVCEGKAPKKAAKKSEGSDVSEEEGMVNRCTILFLEF